MKKFQPTINPILKPLRSKKGISQNPCITEISPDANCLYLFRECCRSDERSSKSFNTYALDAIKLNEINAKIPCDKVMAVNW